MASDWKPTHKSRGDVEVVAYAPDDGYTKVRIQGAGAGILCNNAEFAALFEPLPKPEMVEITLATAIFARDCLQRAGVQLSTLDAAILGAEQEQTP